MEKVESKKSEKLCADHFCSSIFSESRYFSFYRLVVLVYWWCMWSYTFSIHDYIIANYYPGRDHVWINFLTNWLDSTILIYLTLTCLLAWFNHCMPVEALRVCQVLYPVTLATASIVCLIYWTILGGGPLLSWNIHQHVMTLLVMLFELFYCNVPLRFLDVFS